MQADSVAAAMRAVHVQRWASIIVGASVLMVPVIGAVFLDRLTKRRRRGVAAGIWGVGCLAILMYVPVAFVFAVCWGGEVGESGKRRLARALGTPVVQAIEHYHQTHGVYPRTLDQLVPEYLTLATLRRVEDSPLRYPLEYRRDSTGYELTVRYAGPGMNTCRYTARERWECGGYF